MEENKELVEVEKKKNHKVLIITLAIILVATFAIAYAYFSSQAKSEPKTITTGLLKIDFVDGALINEADIEPIKDSEILTKASKKTFTIAKNTKSENVYVRIDLTNLEVSDEFRNYDFKWALYEGNTKLTTGNFANLGTDNSINLMNNILLDSTTPKTYYLYLWIQETNIVQNELQGGRLKGKITVQGEEKKSNTLQSKILGDNNSNVITTSPTFSETSTDKGLYVQKDDVERSEFGFPTYYYRGAVENNYVQFGTHKSDIENTVWFYNESQGRMRSENRIVANTNDPILWRIVRINEDGSIKLVTEYNQGKTQVFNSTRFAKYVNSDGTDSEIKTAVDNWYEANITENNLDSKIQVGSFCNDITGGLKFETGSNNSGNSLTRMLDNAPIFKCLNGSIIANEKAGLLTADELMYAGSIYGVNMDTNISYLNNNTKFATITPQMSNAVLGGFINNRDKVEFQISSYYTYDSSGYATRVVINLKGDVKVSGGNGEESTPYIIN